jgi:NADH-quinone oxidoreductase subunit L
MALSVGVAVAGILAARALYLQRPALDGDRAVAGALAGYYRLISGKYFVDELYDRLVVLPLARLSGFFWRGVDGAAIDGSLHAGAAVTELSGELGRFSTTGNVRNYALYFFLGLLLLFWWIAP